MRTLRPAATGTNRDSAGNYKLRTLRELPKALHATSLAVTAHPSSRRERKAKYSHIEMFKYVENVAQRLRESGVRPGTVCGFALRNSTEAITYFFALQWIGAVAAPVDPGLGREGAVSAMRKAGAATFCSAVDNDEDDLEAVAMGGVAEAMGIPRWNVYRSTNEGVLLETNNMCMAGGAAWAGGAGDFVLDPEEVSCHVQAGSDGDVVKLSHGEICAAVVAFVSGYEIKAGWTTVMVPGIWDMQGLLVMLSVFYSGGHMIMPGGRGGFKGSDFWKMDGVKDVKWISASADDILDLYEGKLSSVKYGDELSFVRVGEGKIASEVVERLGEKLGCPIYESYGTPECAGFATTNSSATTKIGTAGIAAVPGSALAVFDVNSRTQLRNGQEGEICVMGPNVTKGYVGGGEPERLARYHDNEGASWFATGDRGTLDDQGFLTVLGDSRELRAAEIKAMEEAAAREAEKTVSEMEADKKKKAAAAAAAASAAAAAAATANRNAALKQKGIDSQGMDDETAAAILRRIEMIESNQVKLAADLARKNVEELEELRARLDEEEAAADRAAAGGAGAGQPQVLDMRMDELEAAVMAAAASAEMSANNTRQAAEAAKQVAESAFGANQSREVAITSSTGDQGALTKTVRVALDDVEAALRSHPAVEHARAFGRRDKKFGAEVFCAIVPKRGARVSEPWLKLHAQSLLPVTFVPKKFYYLDELPVGMNRRELSESSLLKDLSAFKGYSEVKGSSTNIKGPAYRGPQASGSMGRERTQKPKPMYNGST